MTAFIRRYSAWIVAVSILLSGVSIFLAMGGDRSVTPQMLVDQKSKTLRASERFAQRYGDQSIVVMVRGSLPQLVLTENLGRLLGLEGCLAGRPPGGAQPPGGEQSPCGRLAASKSVQVVYGPGTFVNTAATEIESHVRKQLSQHMAAVKRSGNAAADLANSQGRSADEQRKARNAAATLAYARLARDLLGTGARYGVPMSRLPRIDDPEFVSALVFSSQHPGKPKSRFAYLFPTSKTAIIQVKLRAGLSELQRTAAIKQIRAAVEMPQWQLRYGGSYAVTGAPLIMNDVAQDLTGSLIETLALGVIFMVGVLLLIFRARWRLVPLFVAGCSATVTYGIMAALGASLNLVALAALPIIFGLGVDYAIQYQARRHEVWSAVLKRKKRGLLFGGSQKGASWDDGSQEKVASEDFVAVAKGCTPVVRALMTACIAATTGFLALVFSPLPIVRSFGLFLALGTVIVLAVSLIIGEAFLTFVEKTTLARVFKRKRARGDFEKERVASGGDYFENETASSKRLGGVSFKKIGARRRRLFDLMGNALFSIRRATTSYPRMVLAVGAIAALSGWVIDANTNSQSDPRELAPRNIDSVKNLDSLEEATGIAGEINVFVEGENLASPTGMGWMRNYQDRVLKHFHYSAKKNSCGRADICPALSLPDLFGGTNNKLTQSGINSLLDAIPRYFSQAVISNDRRSANLSFGIKSLSIDRQRQVIGWMKSQLDPPDGVSATLTGLPVIVAEANEASDSPLQHILLMALSLVGVAAVLSLAYRKLGRLILVLVPVLLATGWSALTIYILGVRLNPFSALLGTLVVVVATEFAVLLESRYREERQRGHSVKKSLGKTYQATGLSIVASALTAIAGFGALAISDTPVLSEFGIVAVIDLCVSLIGVLTILPVLAVLFDRGDCSDDNGREFTIYTCSNLQAEVSGNSVRIPAGDKEVLIQREAIPSGGS